MSFSERLQKVMDEKGYTKYKVAKSLHMSATTISNYLKNKTKPDTTKLEVMSLLLGVNRRWLLTGEGEKYRKENVVQSKLTEIFLFGIMTNLRFDILQELLTNRRLRYKLEMKKSES